ncbi:MAG: lysylphosphatidylglycerol synthase domain-containing protein [Myxococcota bacterium]
MSAPPNPNSQPSPREPAQPDAVPSRAVSGPGRLSARRLLPWAAALAILGFLFRDVALAEVRRAFSEAELRSFIPTTLGAATGWFLIESRAFAYLFSRFNAPLSWPEARSLRALTYLLTPINWNLGTGAIILHLRRSKGVAALESTSSLLYYGLIDGLVLASLALVGLLALGRGAELATTVRVTTALVLFQLALLVFFAPVGASWAWRRRARALRIFRTHARARLRDSALLLSLRGLYFTGFAAYFWVGTHAFHVDVPLMHAAASVPVILLAATLPITPGGLGTQQAAMLYFFEPFGSEAQILAFGLAFPVALTLARVPLGLLYLRDLHKLRGLR